MTGLRLCLVVASLAVAPRALPAEEAPPVAPAAPVAAEVPKQPRVTLDLSLGLGGGDASGDGEPLVNLGAHATFREGPIVVAANAEGATNFIGTAHTFVTGGVGGSRTLAVGRLVVTGLCGIHFLAVNDWFGPDTRHRLNALGIRAVWEGGFGSRVMARASVGASAYFDLGREYDPTVARDVGGTTVLVSFGLGLGG